MIGDGKQPGNKGGFTTQVSYALVHRDKDLLRKIAAVLLRKALAEKKRRYGMVILFEEGAKILFGAAPFHERPNKPRPRLAWRRHGAYDRGVSLG